MQTHEIVSLVLILLVEFVIFYGIEIIKEIVKLRRLEKMKVLFLHEV